MERVFFLRDEMREVTEEYDPRPLTQEANARRATLHSGSGRAYGAPCRIRSAHTLGRRCKVSLNYKAEVCMVHVIPSTHYAPTQAETLALLERFS